MGTTIITTTFAARQELDDVAERFAVQEADTDRVATPGEG
jgi:hypothetical protein